MSKIFEDNSYTIGNTPLVRLKRVSKGNVLAKIEGSCTYILLLICVLFC